VKFALGYPELRGPDGDLLDAGPIGAVAAAAEAAGWHGFALTEHPAPGARWLAAGGHQTLDPFVGLAFAAAATQHLRLLTYLSVVPYRNPFLLAKAAASLDMLSGGRLILCVGTGYQKAEFHALGVDFDERNALFDEALDVLPLAWRGEPFSYSGRHFDAREVIALPRPVQRPIPIWIGGNANVTRERVARHGQGWMPLLGSPELSKTTRTAHLESIDELGPLITELRDRAGPRGAQLDVLVDYSSLAAQEPALDAERHRAVLGAFESAGVTWVHIAAPGGRPNAASEFAQAFGATYLGA
jgi:probable F420-dependent oxidoreductase